jgi:AcrR family transcriptional regulator
MARRVRMSAAERRSAILAAALGVLGDRGYHGTSLDEIARAAGVSKALIYEHFSSKRELHAALMQEHIGALFGRLQANAERGGTGAERLRGGIDAFFCWVEDGREAFRVLFRDIADPELAEGMQVVRAQVLGVIKVLMAADPDVPPAAERTMEIFGVQLAGGMQALAAWWEDHPDVPRAELVDRAMDLCWHGLDRTSAGAAFSAG